MKTRRIGNLKEMGEFEKLIIKKLSKVPYNEYIELTEVFADYILKIIEEAKEKYPRWKGECSKETLFKLVTEKDKWFMEWFGVEGVEGAEKEK